MIIIQYYAPWKPLVRGSVTVHVHFYTITAMVTKTALITLVSTLLIAILALSVEKSGTHLGPAPDPASITGASGSWATGGGRGNWGTASMTGASGSYGGGGGRGNWGQSEHGEHDEHEGGWDGDDD